MKNTLRMLLVSGLLFAGATISQTTRATAQDAPAMPPQSVSVLTIREQSIPVQTELPGRIAATRVSEVRARVSGILTERVFSQGALVMKGSVLYRIDRELFEVRVQSAEASLQRTIAVQTNAQQHYERQKVLRDREAASGASFDTAAAALAQANADVALAKAALNEAKINLSYTEIRAPITGIIGAALITEGALVTASGTQNLALIQQIDPVYADFTQSSNELLALKRALENGTLESPGPNEAKVQLLLSDGTVYPHAGKLLFTSASVDITTGQVTLRAEFPNTSGELLPGLYVRVRIEQAVRQRAIAVPQRAVIRAADGSAQIYVLVKEDVPELRPVKLGRAFDSNWIVESGLTAGDRIVVDGAHKIHAGAKIIVEPEKVEQTPPSATQQQQKK